MSESAVMSTLLPVRFPCRSPPLLNCHIKSRTTEALDLVEREILCQADFTLFPLLVCLLAWSWLCTFCQGFRYDFEETYEEVLLMRNILANNIAVCLLPIVTILKGDLMYVFDILNHIDFIDQAVRESLSFRKYYKGFAEPLLSFLLSFVRQDDLRLDPEVRCC